MEKLRRELIEVKILKKSNNGYVWDYLKKLKNNPVIYDKILKQTSFLDQYNSTIQERLFYIQNILLKPVLCQTCKKNKVNLKKNKLTVYCSNYCVGKSHIIQEKKKQTNLKNYGVEHPLRDPDIRKQIKITNLKRYGVEYPTQSEEIQNRVRQTCLQRYGVEHISQSTSIKEKKKTSSLEKFNTEYPSQNDDIKKKIIQTNIQKYGYNSPMQTKAIQHKSQQTCFKNHGVKYSMQSNDVLNKSIQTNLLRYGKKYPILNKDIKEKAEKTTLKNYGVENPFQSKVIKKQIIITYQEKYNRNNIKQIHIPLYTLELLNNKEWMYLQHYILKKTIIQLEYELQVSDVTIARYLHKHGLKTQYYTNKSFKADQWLNYISTTKKIKLIKEYRVPNTKYIADGFEPDTNTIYEFHGDFWHGNPNIFNLMDINPKTNCSYQELYKNTIKKETKLKQLGYNIISIWESEWDTNTNKIQNSQ